GLGMALYFLGRYQAAEAAFREAVRLKPSYARAWGDLGELLGEQRRFEEAAEVLRESVRVKPQRIASHRSLTRLPLAPRLQGGPAGGGGGRLPRGLEASAHRQPEPLQSLDGPRGAGQTQRVRGRVPGGDLHPPRLRRSARASRRSAGEARSPRGGARRVGRSD